MIAESPIENFLTSEQYIEAAATQRREIKVTCGYPIQFLSDTLVGIHPKELIVIGSSSGCGKSELVEQIAFHNAMQGQRVALFSLEGDENEFADRQRWKALCALTKNKFIQDGYTYMHYRLNRIPDLEPYEEFINKDLKTKLKNIYLYDKRQNLNARNVSNRLTAIAPHVDLLIIDHLHYFEMLETSSENFQLTGIMMTINNLLRVINIPIIVVSHIRKPESMGLVMPSKEDFMGSSNIYKVANTCIMM